MSLNNSILFLLTILKLINQIEANLCRNQEITNSFGKIQIKLSGESRFANSEASRFADCTWTITPPPNSTTTLSLINLELINCEGNKLKIQDQEFCNVRGSKLLSLRDSRIRIELLATHKNSKVWLEFQTRPSNECGDYDFQCKDRSGCFNNSEVCDGIFQCEDHSDEMNCGSCKSGEGNFARCSYYNSTLCFSPGHQRCNGIIDCLHGEDEIHCFKKECDEWYKCKSKCIPQEKICDGYPDCEDGSDENNCKLLECQNTYDREDWEEMCDEKGNAFLTLKSLLFSVIIIVFALSMIFGATIYKWYKSRRNIQDIIEDMPEFPLPPFEGPGENDDREQPSRFTTEDFLAGGEIFDAFAQTRRRLYRKKKKPFPDTPLSVPQTRNASPSLTKCANRENPYLSKDKTIEDVVEDFYPDQGEESVTIEYINEKFLADNNSSEINEEETSRLSKFRRMFHKNRVRSADEFRVRRPLDLEERDLSVFSVK